MKNVQKVLSVLLAGAMAVSAAACGETANSSAAGSGTAASKAANGDFSTIDQIKLGEDGKDVKAEIKFLTNRTDIVDTKLKDYVKEFQKMYPNISVKYEGVTNYADDVTTRVSTKDWGDVCSIPASVTNSEMDQHFLPLGKVDTLSKTYNFASKNAYNGIAYGISSVGEAQGIVYNKQVFKDAGITALPKTPTEFMTDLKTIKDKTKAIPLYTNFAAKWTMGAWDAYIGGCATGDADFMNQKLAKMKDPFAKTAFADGTGPYAVYNILYQAVSQGLTEDDPTTTDWESSKAKLNNGQIATMVLGSWAVTQMQQAGKNANDVAYMPFPITVNGQQYATMGSDYCYGINKNSSKDNQTAAMLYIKYLTEKSNFAYSEGGVPVVKGAELPATLADFKNIKMIEDTPAKDGEEDLFTNVNNDSKISLNSDNDHIMSIVQSAKKKDKTLDQIVAEWNKKWTAAQKSNDVEQS